MRHLLKITHCCGHDELVSMEADTDQEALEKGNHLANEICLACMDYHCMIWYMLHGSTPSC
jgi:hypothetical protein